MTTFFFKKVIPNMSFVVLVQAGRHLLEILTDDGMMDEMNNNNMHESGSVSASLTTDVFRNVKRVCSAIM